MKPTPNATPKPTFSHQAADEERSMPLGVGDMAAEDTSADPLAGSGGEGRRFRSGSIVLVAVVAIGAGGLWFMRSLSHVSGASAATDVEKSIEGFLSGRDSKGNLKAVSSRREDDVLRVISESYSSKFVPLESVQRNPFILPGEQESKVVAPITGDEPADVIARARTQRQKDIESAASRLSIKSIIMSNNPLANISGMIVRVGDEIAPEGSDITFRVQAITADTVTLVSDDLALGMHVEVPLSMRRDK